MYSFYLSIMLRSVRLEKPWWSLSHSPSQPLHLWCQSSDSLALDSTNCGWDICRQLVDPRVTSWHSAAKMCLFTSVWPSERRKLTRWLWILLPPTQLLGFSCKEIPALFESLLPFYLAHCWGTGRSEVSLHLSFETHPSNLPRPGTKLCSFLSFLK